MDPNKARVLVEAVQGPNNEHFDIKKARRVDAAEDLSRVIHIREVLEGGGEPARVSAMTDFIDTKPGVEGLLAVLDAAGNLEYQDSDERVVIRVAEQLLDSLADTRGGSNDRNVQLYKAALALIRESSDIIFPHEALRVLNLADSKFLGKDAYFDDAEVESKLLAEKDTLQMFHITEVLDPDDDLVRDAYDIATGDSKHLDPKVRARAIEYVIDNIDCMDKSPSGAAKTLLDVVDLTIDPDILTRGLIAADIKLKARAADEAAFQEEKVADLVKTYEVLSRKKRELVELDAPLFERGRKPKRAKLRETIVSLERQQAGVDKRQFEKGSENPAPRFSDTIEKKAVFILKSAEGQALLDQLLAEGPASEDGANVYGTFVPGVMREFTGHYQAFVRGDHEDGIDSVALKSTYDWIVGKTGVAPRLSK